MILLVTSHPQTRATLPPLIADHGYKVDTIDCTDELPKRLRFHKPALVVLDCGLPDSFDLLTQLRADPLTRPTPAILFSTDDQNLREKALLKGADAYVPKGSLDWIELLAEIKRFAPTP